MVFLFVNPTTKLKKLLIITYITQNVFLLLAAFDQSVVNLCMIFGICFVYPYLLFVKDLGLLDLNENIFKRCFLSTTVNILISNN